MRRDIITKIEASLTSDGQGGWIEETQEIGSFDVKLSIGGNIEEATAYGVSIEQILKIIATIPLLENKNTLKTYFIYSGKKYEARMQIPFRSSQYLITLVEVVK